MKNILIIGAGGLGKEVVDIINDLGSYNIAGFLDDDPKKKDTIINGKPVLDTIAHLDKYRNVDNIAIAIANPEIRRQIFEYSKSIGFHFPNLIHPTVICGSTVKIGCGNIIGAYSILSTEVMLHDFVIINPQCGIGHESEIGSFTTLYWNVHVGGKTSILNGCEIGSKSCVLQGLHITDNVILGAGAVVISDIDESGTYVGVPIRKHK